jgi:PPIC-type PPIASE domain
MPSLQIRDNQISSDRTLKYLADSQLLPQILREMVVDELIDRVVKTEQIDLTPSVAEWDRLAAQIAKISPFQGMNSEQFDAITARTLKLHKFKQAGWGHRVNEYYQSIEHRLHRVVYSVLHVEDGLLAQELFFRVQSGEQSFKSLVQQYSPDPTLVQRGGIVGPISIDKIPAALVQTVTKLHPGELSPLFQLDRYYGFIRLEDWIPATLDENMRQLLLDELFENWIQERIGTEIGQNAEISLIEVETPSQPPALITSEPVKTLSSTVEIPEPWADTFTPNFARRETIIAQEQEISLPIDSSHEQSEPNTPEVTIVVEPVERDLDVTTGFFFPNLQSDDTSPKVTSSLSQKAIDDRSIPSLIPSQLTEDPMVESQSRSRKLTIGILLSIALCGIGINYLASSNRVQESGVRVNNPAAPKP